jgi:hypothetical protein
MYRFIKIDLNCAKEDTDWRTFCLRLQTYNTVKFYKQEVVK